MKKMKSLVAVVLFSSAFTFAQGPALKFPAASPLQTLKQDVGISSVTFEYSRPSANGRVIFGNVVPYGQFWRAGANAPTKIIFESEAVINGAKIPAGAYSLFTYPKADEWTIVINKNLNVRSEAEHDKSQDVANFKVKTAKTAGFVEVFTIDFAKVAPTKTTVDLKWENTVVSFDIAFDYDNQLTANIEKALASDSRPFYQAARYYYDNKKDLKKALEWATVAYANSPTAYWVGTLKAKIQLDLNDKKGALETLEAVKKNGNLDAQTAAGIEELIQKAKAK